MCAFIRNSYTLGVSDHLLGGLLKNVFTGCGYDKVCVTMRGDANILCSIPVTETARELSVTPGWNFKPRFVVAHATCCRELYSGS